MMDLMCCLGNYLVGWGILLRRVQFVLLSFGFPFQLHIAHNKRKLVGLLSINNIYFVYAAFF